MKTLYIIVLPCIVYHIGVTSASRSESLHRNVTAEKVTENRFFRLHSVDLRRLYVKAISTTFYECTKSS